MDIKSLEIMANNKKYVGGLIGIGEKNWWNLLINNGRWHLANEIESIVSNAFPLLFQYWKHDYLRVNSKLPIVSTTTATMSNWANVNFVTNFVGHLRWKFCFDSNVSWFFLLSFLNFSLFPWRFIFYFQFVLWQAWEKAPYWRLLFHFLCISIDV